jgi:hypothetical protein
MLKRYGGPLDKPKFDSVSFCAIKSPPMSSFAMFAEVHADKKAPMLDVSKGISRPKIRDSMPVEARHTGKEPVLLKVLASVEPEPHTEPRPEPELAEAPAQAQSPKRKRTKKGSAPTQRSTTSLSCFMETEP